MTIKEQLQSAIDYCNAKLSAKGVTEQATSVVDVGNKIENIQSEDTGVGSRQWWMEVCAEKTIYTAFFRDVTFMTEAPPIDYTNATSISSAFYGCTSLITIPLMNVPNVVAFSSAFIKCESLVHISFVKETIHKSISFIDSPLLDGESRQSILDGLADLTGQNAQTITFHPDVKDKLTEEQIASATSKNWNIA